MSFVWSVFAYAGWLMLAASYAPARGRARIALRCAVAVAAAPFAWAARGLLGDPAYVTGLLTWLVAITRTRGLSLPGGVMSLGNALSVLLVDAALIVSAVSAVPWDFYYAPGFGSPTRCAMVALGCALFAVRRVSAYTLAVPAAVLLGFTGWHESHNAWDWFFDPTLAVWAAGLLALRLREAARRPRAFVDELPPV